VPHLRPVATPSILRKPRRVPPRCGIARRPTHPGCRIALEHYDAILSHYGTAVGVRAARKHLGWYLDSILGAGRAKADPVHAARRQALLTEKAPERVAALFADCVDSGLETNHQLGAVA